MMNRITTAARGARASTGIMASASGTIPATRYSFNAQRTHSINSQPLKLMTRTQSSRVSLTAEPNSDSVQKHAATQTGIHAVTAAPNYPLPSPMQLGIPQQGGAQSQFGIPTVRASITAPSMQLHLPIMRRKSINAGRASMGRPTYSNQR